MTERQQERAIRDQEMAQLRQGGMKIHDIAELYGCGTATVQRAFERVRRKHLQPRQIAQLLEQVEKLQRITETQGRRLVYLEAYREDADKELERLRQENNILQLALKRAHGG